MTSTSSLDRHLETVSDRATFIAFVHILVRDRQEEEYAERRAPSNPHGSGHNGWENATIATFLEASLAWAEAVGNLTDERKDWFPEAPSWQAFARFLYMGKIYE